MFAPLPEMDDGQYAQWNRLLERRTGMCLPPERRSFLVTNVGLRMREIGCGSYQEYYDLVRDGVRGRREWATLVDRLTVHETRFFRHPQALELVREYAAAKRPEVPGAAVSIQGWSAGCATGEEAYSLAMVVDQALLGRSGPSYYGVVATDISPPALARARQGRYRPERVGELEPAVRRRYFEEEEDGTLRVVDWLRRRVCFARMNIFHHERHPMGPMDFIYCQNVLIYFDRARRVELVTGLVQYLVPGGLLVLGSGDVVGWNHPQLEKIHNRDVLAWRRVA